MNLSSKWQLNFEGVFFSAKNTFSQIVDCVTLTILINYCCHLYKQPLPQPPNRHAGPPIGE